MDSGSSCEVIYEHCFMKLKPSIRASKVDSKVPLIRFLGEKSWSTRKIPLEITIGDALSQKMVIVVSTIHGAIKFHTTEGIGTAFLTYESDKVKEGMTKVIETPPASEKGVYSCTTTEEKVVINNKYPEQTVTIEKKLPEHFKGRLRDLLRANADVFAWTHVDMTGIPRTIMVKGKPFNTEHKLNEYSHVKPIKQKRRGLVPDRSTTACKEVEELTKARTLQKVKNQTWVANPVMGYHQIQMAERDEDKTAFFVGEGVFCYRKMPFSLKNAGATYQRFVNKVFHDQIGRNLEAYVDDMEIKTPVQGEILMMYLTASTESTSAALFPKREEEQVPIYFVSRVLVGPN
ncbi:hypothetical protein Tco_0438565 [Tanacetum coccineum]